MIVCAAIIFTIIQRNNSPKLTEQDVQKIALEDASITEDDATSISISYEQDDNEYEVEILSENNSKKYEYTIDGNSGKIEERETESITINKNVNN